MSNVLSGFVVDSIFNSPIYIVLLVGIVIAIRRRDMHPRISRLALTGMTILLVSKLLNEFILLTMVQASNSGAIQNLDTTVGIVREVFVFVDLVGWVYVVRAIFADKTKRKNENDTFIDEETPS